MMPILFAFIAFLAWGSGDLFGTMVSRKIGSFSATFWSYLSRLILFGLYIPFAIKDFHHYTMPILGLNLFLGLLLLVGFLAFNHALKIANPSIVGTISASFIAVVVILSIMFLGDRISLAQIIPISIIFFGVLLTSLVFGDLKLNNFLKSGILLAIIAMLSWGIYFTFIKIVIKEVGWFWPNYVSFTLVVILFLLSKVKDIPLANPVSKKAILPLLATVILTGLAEFCFNYALQKGYGSMVTPIAGAYPILFVLLSYLVFKEPLSKQQKFGVLTTLIGIALLSFAAK